MADRRGREVLGEYYARIEDRARHMFQGAGAERYGGGGVMQMLNDMPLVSVLMFQSGAWPKHPEDLVADLLRQAHQRA